VKLGVEGQIRPLIAMWGSVALYRMVGAGREDLTFIESVGGRFVRTIQPLHDNGIMSDLALYTNLLKRNGVK